MEPYIKSMIEEMPSNMTGVAVDPAGPHLFEVNASNPDYLNAKESEICPHGDAASVP
jgi:hypothetical protein